MRNIKMYFAPQIVHERKNSMIKFDGLFWFLCFAQSDLQKFIPTLIRHSTGCKRPEYGKEGSRPQWWPKELPWSNPMVQPKSTRSGVSVQLR